MRCWCVKSFVFTVLFKVASLILTNSSDCSKSTRWDLVTLEDINIMYLYKPKSTGIQGHFYKIWWTVLILTRNMLMLLIKKTIIMAYTLIPGVYSIPISSNIISFWPTSFRYQPHQSPGIWSIITFVDLGRWNVTYGPVDNYACSVGLNINRWMLYYLLETIVAKDSREQC